MQLILLLLFIINRMTG